MESVQLAEVLPPECAAQSRLSCFVNELPSVVFERKTIHSIPESFFFSPEKTKQKPFANYVLLCTATKFSQIQQRWIQSY